MPLDHAAIAGGGIGGLTAAIALAQRGFRVSLFERAPILEEIGAGIQLSPNATRVLTSLGLGGALAGPMVEPGAIILRDGWTGSEITRLPLIGAAERWGAPYGVIHRGDLQKVLYEAAARTDGVALNLDSIVTGAKPIDSEIIATVERGPATAEVTADLLIGADGLWSSVRRAMGDATEPTFSGKRAWRSVIPFRELPSRLRAQVTTLWLGPGAHLVHYPVSAGDALNVVAVVDSADAGPGWAAPGTPDELVARFSGWTGELREILAEPRGWTTWPLFDRREIGPLASGRMALIGDAAHPVLPFLAQGGALAIEDAAVLAAALRRRRGDVPARLAWYAEMRQGRVRRVQREARRNGAIYHWPRPAAMARNLALRALGGQSLLVRYDWLYGWSPVTP